MCSVSGHLAQFMDGSKIYRGESRSTGVFTCMTKGNDGYETKKPLVKEPGNREWFSQFH